MADLIKSCHPHSCSRYILLQSTSQMARRLFVHLKRVLTKVKTLGVIRTRVVFLCTARPGQLLFIVTGP